MFRQVDLKKKEKKAKYVPLIKKRETKKEKEREIRYQAQDRDTDYPASRNVPIGGTGTRFKRRTKGAVRRDRRKRKSGIPGCREDICVMKYPEERERHAAGCFRPGLRWKKHTRGKATDSARRYFHAPRRPPVRLPFVFFYSAAKLFLRAAEIRPRSLANRGAAEEERPRGVGQSPEGTRPPFSFFSSAHTYTGEAKYGE